MSTHGPLFVLGMNGSGTTMLLDSLGRHSELYAYPHETRLIPHLLQQYQTVDLADDSNFRKLWDSVIDIPAFKRREIALPDNWENAPRSVAGVINHLMSLLAANDAKNVWCEKSPMHVQHIPLLAQTFPNARFIHMIRDGRDCAASFHRRWSRTPILTVQRWKQAVRKGHADGTQLGERYLELHYESLTKTPRDELQRVCTFLGIDFEDEILASSQPYLHGSWHNPETGTITQNTRNWRDYFNPQDITALEAVCGKVLYERGYDCDNKQGDRNLSTKQRKLLMLRDQARQFAHEVKLKASGKLERPWRQILAKPLAALKQNSSH